MSWDEVWGHGRAIAAMQQALAHGRLSQSLLLSGPPSVGKTLIAATLAQSLLCQAAPAPCGTCRSCQAVTQRAHPDCLWLEPESPTTHIPLEAIRHVLQQLHQTPVQGARHVAVILTIEQLSGEAATTLLKTLEEPPPAAHLILTTHDVGRCLPTIVSRCQLLRLMPCSRDILTDLLVTKRRVAPDLARRLAVIAEGRAGTALQLLERADLPTVERFVEQLTGPREWSGERRSELFGVLEQYLWWCRDRVCELAGCAELASTHETAPPLQAPRTLEESSDVLTEALALVEALEDRANPKLIQWTLQQRWGPT